VNASNTVASLVIATTICLLPDSASAQQPRANAQPRFAGKNVLIVYLSRTSSSSAALISLPVPLPADLLAASSHPEGGKWVLVIGAGSSVEHRPTCRRVRSAQSKLTGVCALTVFWRPIAQVHGISPRLPTPFSRPGNQTAMALPVTTHALWPR
jgi:hypothetical protein